MTKSKLISSMYNYERHGHYRQADRIFNYLIKTAQEYVDLYSDGEDIDYKDIRSDKYDVEKALSYTPHNISREDSRALLKTRIYTLACYIVKMAFWPSSEDKYMTSQLFNKLIDNADPGSSPGYHVFNFIDIQDELKERCDLIYRTLKKERVENPKPKNFRLFHRDCITYAYNHLLSIILPLLSSEAQKLMPPL